MKQSIVLQPVKKRQPVPTRPLPVDLLKPREDKEKIAHWVKRHLVLLTTWNEEGWRWSNIAKAVGQHLDHPMTRNKLTGMITMIRKEKLAKRQIS